MVYLRLVTIPLLLVLMVSAVHAQDRPLTLQELDAREQQESLMGSLERVKVLAEKIVQEKRAHCIRAFGHPAFCECLSSEMPVGASFLTYVQVVTSTKDALRYSAMSKDDKALVDTTIAAREVCVKRMSGQRK